MSRWRLPRPGHDRIGAGEVRQLVLVAARGAAGPARSAREVLSDLPEDVVVPVLRPVIDDALAAAWPQGWQPAEVVWQAGRRRRAVAQVAAGIVAAGDWPAEVHPAWRGQLDDLVPPAGGVDEAPVEDLVDLAVVLLGLPPVEVLLPVPGRPDVAVAAVAAASTTGIDAKVLERVRALLAKAESSTFEAEAQAFTAKAHELMTRHSLEHALVTGPVSDAGPRARRFCVDDPYADAKSHLLAVIVHACRGTAVLLGGLSMVTVVAFPDDLAQADVLFTSLLVQAQAALDQLSRDAPPGSRERTRGYRSSFLRGFAHRIGDRLEEAGAAAVADIDRASGGALVPVLAERGAAVAHQVAELHPRLRAKHVAPPADRLGWWAGREAADRADLPWDRLESGGR